jgi:hypothetical protein
MDMNLGGPVWHASVAGSLIKAVLQSEAERQLAGVGDASLGEWLEVTGKAVHIRRRLTEREQRAVGPVVDIRGSDEARMRAARLGPRLRLAPPEVLAEEIGRLRAS